MELDLYLNHFHLLLEVIPKDFQKKTLVSLKPVEAGASADWTGTYTPPVKDQGYCGSCWAFSATEQIESDAMRVFKDSNPDFDFQLAPQQITSCDEYDGGCNGGNIESAYRYVEEVRGLENEKDYPYVDGLGVSDHSIVSSRGTSKCDSMPIKEKVCVWRGEGMHARTTSCAVDSHHTQIPKCTPT